MLSVLAFEFPLSTKPLPPRSKDTEFMFLTVLRRTVGACHTPRSDEPELWLALGAVVLRWDSESSCFFQFCLHRQATIWGRPSHKASQCLPLGRLLRALDPSYACLRVAHSILSTVIEVRRRSRPRQRDFLGRQGTALARHTGTQKTMKHTNTPIPQCRSLFLFLEYILRAHPSGSLSIAEWGLMSCQNQYNLLRLHSQIRYQQPILLSAFLVPHGYSFWVHLHA